jgi:beta-ureidopropionase / N-carbamoyl-L-amino-acid hydrolase
MEIKETWRFGYEPFSTECIALLRETAREMCMPFREMKSQAGHDAYSIAKVVPTCMIFTPCRDGLSHNVREDVAPSQAVPGANLLLNAVVRRANR